MKTKPAPTFQPSEDQVQDSLDRIEVKLDKLDDRSYRQTAMLEGMARRVSNAELRISQLETEIKPLKKHDDMWSGAAKAVAVLSAVAGLIAAAAGAVIALRHMIH